MLPISRFKLLVLLSIACVTLSLHAMRLDSQLLNAATSNLLKVQAALRAGADINAQDYWGNTALMLAATHNQRNIVELLLAAGADVTIKNSNNETVLKLAKDKYMFKYKYKNEPRWSKKGYRDMSKKLLKAYIEQRKKLTKQELEEKILESKKAELRETMQGLPADVVKYAEQFIKL